MSESEKRIEEIQKDLVGTAAAAEDPGDRKEARGLLSRFSKLLGRGEPRWVEIGPPDKITGKQRIEKGKINEEGEREPDSSPNS